MVYDVAIVGTGPAGLGAALTLKLHNKEIIWFGSAELSDKVGKSEKIANYPGVPMVSGEDLNAAFAAQARDMELEPKEARVTNIRHINHIHFTCTRCGKTYCLEDFAIPVVTLPQGFQTEEAEYIVKGTCPNCAG